MRPTTDLRGSLETEMTARLLNADRYYSVGFDDAEGAMDGSTEPTTSEGDLANGGGAEAGGERVEGEDFSGTNNQEEGVDEADFVKTDGYHIYVLNGNRLEIMGVPNFGELNHASTTEIEGNPLQMLLGDDRMVVFSNVNVYQGYRRRTEFSRGRRNGTRKQLLLPIPSARRPRLSTLLIARPRVERELYLESGYKTARRVEQSIWMVGYSCVILTIILDMAGLRRILGYDYDDPRRDEDLSRCGSGNHCCQSRNN